MSQTRVPFQFIGNDTALDFVNTLVAYKDAPLDLIPDAAKFDGWLKAAGITPKRTFSMDEMQAIYGLRTAMKAVFDARMSDKTPSAQDIATIDAYVASYTPNLQLTYVNKTFTLRPRDEELEPHAILGKLAQMAAELLASVADGTLKNCSNPECVLVYKDTSRGSKRRWCSMKTCGNRAKVAAFRDGLS
ncbi:hypothetical protein F9L33_11625 [Amylibacter sp. SFDW26]|uniref:CGNR zinc finger domain-containing protein n=1 Tax=Amylibacter sp. SFDW26 TaxID=2652722 RepID=UPI001261F14F|nr:CGNR zinc finger domain-containing protein [Amylibacter sp. SFDW26]KAB7613250.1 hypothetical protein F9L33_11625 [Amylibacter sp. SFDW26]